MRSTSCFAFSMAALLGCGEDIEIPRPRTDDNPVLLWVGDTADLPMCPDGRLDYWDGWADVRTAPQYQNECGTCACSPAACVLPDMVKAHEAALCADEGIEVKLADAADPPGHCIKTSPPVPGDAFASVTIGPPTMAPACQASAQFTPPPLGGTFARACPWTGEYRTGFDGLVCIAPEHDGSCRPGFSARFEFKEKIRDARTCTACECGEPVGGVCVADVLLFSDTSCSDMLISINGIGTEEEICYGAPADSPLAGARVVFARDEPGTCSPKATVSLVDGTIESGATRTFCCSSEEIIYGNVDN
ncbi:MULTISPECIES: hypothetical protein [Sorangium]|uniref:Uncharacterized protein n=1 Tax=Sorangium cellulosum TaxID=56 RepID=A0A4P2R324_SORCE|nr:MULTISPECIES: hypothetical protein [Sorangium]AUX37345.1 hypothetical protein SOCE836_095680 [Sorangium cellulosum]WCQ96634.1 hypothetical protein NQZ70_09421 [Sorangium sp. Soce836]